RQDHQDDDPDDTHREHHLAARDPAPHVPRGGCGVEAVRDAGLSHSDQAALWPIWGAGTGTPASVYSFSLLRSVRIEMPRMLAACVRLPKQCCRVSMISCCSISETVWPTKARVAVSAATEAAWAVRVCASAG